MEIKSRRQQRQYDDKQQKHRAHVAVEEQTGYEKGGDAVENEVIGAREHEAEDSEHWKCE
jgi:hypothetical protein